MNKYWFRARKGMQSKDKGWGFVPISWEGAVAYLVLLALIVWDAWYFDILHANTIRGFYFLIVLIILLGVFSLLNKSRTRK